ncbi:MAG: hypothetical protein ACXVRJ_02425 [Gaiellaceae bacterium]
MALPIRVRSPGAPAAAATLAAALAAVGIVGADLPWLVPVGHEVASGRLPDSIPFAVAATAHWHDPLAAGQLVVWAAYRFVGGDRGLLLLQALAAAVSFGALAAGLRRQASDGAALVACVLVLVGGASSVLVARASLFSLALFPVLLLLLEEDALRPSRRIWLVVPLLAVWGNLHGMALAGLGLVVAYLAFARGRREPRLAGGVAAASVLALCATPVLLHTPSYYRGVFENEAAARGAGLWAPLGFGAFDLLYVSAGVLLVWAGRRHVRLWEGASILVLTAASVHTARLGLWLLFVAAYPAARGLRVRPPRARVMAILTVGLALVMVAALVQRRHDPRDALAREAAARHQVVLADPLAAERVALYGGRIWVANPIDAFRRVDQRLYLDWVAGRRSGAAAIDRAGLVLVQDTSSAGGAARNDPRLRRVRAAGGEVLYEVVAEG